MQRPTLPGFGPLATRELLRGHIDWRLALAKRTDHALEAIDWRTRPARNAAHVALATARVAPIAWRILTSRYPLHVHTSSESRDCDGRLDRSHVSPIRSRLAWARIVLTTPIDYARSEFGGVVTVEAGELHSYAITEEGYRSSIERVCADRECDLEERSQRDHTAEAMGY